MISKKQLGDGETVVLAMRQHLKALFLPAVLFIVVCAAAGFVAAIVPDGDSQLLLRLLIAAVGLIVIGRWVLWPFLRWRASTYVVTNERILTRHGVIRQHGRTMPLSRVNDVAFDHGLLDRMVGCGTLVVSSGGELGQLVLPDVPKVESVQREIYALVEQVQGGRREALPDEAPYRPD